MSNVVIRKPFTVERRQIENLIRDQLDTFEIKNLSQTEIEKAKSECLNIDEFDDGRSLVAFDKDKESVVGFGRLIVDPGCYLLTHLFFAANTSGVGTKLWNALIEGKAPGMVIVKTFHNSVVFYKLLGFETSNAVHKESPLVTLTLTL